MGNLSPLKVLKHYPYETVRVIGNTVTFPRSAMRDFESQLAELAGFSHSDNKECYYVDLGSYQAPKYFMFHDFWMIMGDEVEPYWRK